MKRVTSRATPADRSRAVERGDTARRGWLRLMRTIVLGTIATVAAIIWLADQYGIEREVILEFLGTSVLFVLVLVGAGLLGTLCLMLCRKLLRRGE